MIKSIEGKSIEITIEKEKLNLPVEIKEKIEKYWQGVISENPNLWNGEVACVSQYNEKDREVEIVCKKSDYAHYIYDERVILPKKYACFNLAAGCLLETKDGYYVIGELEKNTSYPYCLQISGGNIDKQDVNGNSIDIMKTIRREVKEELNISVDDKKLVENYVLKYINTPTPEVHVYEIFAKGILKITAEEMNTYYDEYLNYLKENNLEIEFRKIHLIKKENAIEELRRFKNPRRIYLEKLLEIDSNS